MKSKWTMAATIALAAFLGLAGCEGDDGRDGTAGPAGPTGPQGPEGPPGDSVVTLPLESCGVCHDDGAFADAAAEHAITSNEIISDVVVTADGADLVVDFMLEVDGVPTAGYDAISRFYRVEGPGGVVDRGLTGTITDNGDGSYTVTAPGAVTVENNRYLLRVEIDAVGRESRVYTWFDYPDNAFGPPAASAESCTNCHGPEGIDVHGGYYAAADGVEPCLVCHGNDYRDDGTLLVSLAEAAHKYHAGIWEDDGEFVDVTYPTYMTNCSVCHDSPATLATVNAMPVSGEGCFTCHGSMDGFDFTGLEFHLDIPDPLTADCGQCHDGGLARETVAEFHNGIETERGGIIFNGVDTSVTEGAKIAWQITEVVDDGVNLEISWTATYDGVGVNPCNATAGAGAPVFHADGNGNLSILRNYAQGGDYILGTSANNAGQPGSSPGVSVDNTTCTSNVATTVVPVEETDAMYGRVAIQGKPRLPSVLGGGELMAVRAFTPTYDWVIGDGAKAPARRAVVDSQKCLKCHVGSMYQHGGNRVDNVDMCYLCHNTAANDEYVRVNTFDVDASEAYDGRAGQNFGMKEMLHAVHSAGATGAPIVIYRGRGIYAWGESTDLLPNWPGSGRFPVFGSDDGTGTPVTQNHTFHTPTYPRSLNECGACHVEELGLFPDPTKAMASTVAGATDGDQLDDVLEGAQTSSCVTCHRGDGDGVYNAGDEAAVKGHAYQNSWTPQDFPEGRQTIIDAAK